MGVLILGNKSVVKRKSYITMLVFISTIIILFLIVNMNENSSKIKVKGGEGYGMFDKATRIEIIFNDNEYIVSNPDEIEQIIRLCRQNWEPSNTHITKEDCDMCVKFIGTDTEVWVDTETLSSYIGESFVQMPEDLFKKIKEVVSLTGTYPTRYGVILVTADKYKGLIPTGHAGIIWTSSTIVESLSNGVTTGPNDWNTSKTSCYGISVKGTTVDEDNEASNWCYRQLGKPYNYNYFNVSTRKKFYCSQLVWAAFKDNYGIDLDTSDFGDAVHPMELVNSSKTYTIYKK